MRESSEGGRRAESSSRGTSASADETRLGMGARVKYLGAVATVIRHGADKYGKYTLISLSGMKARVCPDMLTALDPPREVIVEVAK